MKRLLAATVIFASITGFSMPAQAGGGYGYSYGYGYSSGDIYAAAGIIGGAILLGSLLSRPRYYAYPPPAPVYYGPPRAPVCTREDVYRYLPDGRIQWGVRTRCY